MNFISNFRIGTKMAMMSGLGVLLVVGMLAGAIYGNSEVVAANAKATGQQTIVRDITRIEVGFLQVRMAVRNIRLATTKSEMVAADTLAERQKTIDGIIDSLIPRFTLPENRQRAQNIKSSIDQYISIAFDRDDSNQEPSARAERRRAGAFSLCRNAADFSMNVLILSGTKPSLFLRKLPMRRESCPRTRTAPRNRRWRSRSVLPSSWARRSLSS